MWILDWLRLLRRSRHPKPQRSVKPLQYRKMLKVIHDLYARDETFLDYLAHDLDDDASWFNSSEFARFHDVNGKKILSIFTANARSQTLTVNVGAASKPEGITRSQGVLFCRAHDLKKAASGQPLKLNGKLYTISEARLIQDQVWRIVLEANNP